MTFKSNPTPSPIGVKNADLNWKNNSPLSRQYDDIYFNPELGFNESIYNFIDGNKLQTRVTNTGKHFVVGETGFGTGLNFLLTASLWSSRISSNSHLTFISTEKHPLLFEDLQRMLNLWDLGIIAEELLSQYPINASGMHHISCLNGQIRLLLIYGDAAESYSKLHAKVDAWYLDGFAPSKNPDMWSPELFEQIARLSKPGTTFSTFTAAGMVRRGLQDVGFEVKKQKGFGRKREMLVGTFTKDTPPAPSVTPWFDLPSSKKPEEVIVIGGGIAGCTTANALAMRGIKVKLIEKEQELATGGSGNRQGALYAKLPVQPTPQGELHITGFLHTLNQLKRIDPNESYWSQCGVVQLATTEKELKRQSTLIKSECYPEALVQDKSKDEISSLAGADIEHQGLYFPDAGWVSPKDFCKALSEHKNIEVIRAGVDSICQENKQWTITTCEQQELSASHLVICTAEQTNQFEQTKHLPLKTIRGQVSVMPVPENSTALKTVVCGEGYISPPQDGYYCFGATFDLKGTERDIKAKDHQENLKNLSETIPELANLFESSFANINGRTAFRCSTPDYMPIVGPAPVYEAYLEDFAQLRKDKNWRFGNIAPQHHSNLYVNTGHGSKGLITCPISAELLASMICEEPLPLPKNLIDMINPARFIVKNLIKQAI